MAKVKRVSSKKGGRPRAKLSKPRPAEDTHGATSPRGLRRAFFKLEELGKRLRGQKENLVIDWDIDIPKEDEKDQDQKSTGSIEKAEENPLPVLHRLSASNHQNVLASTDTVQPIAPPPTPAAQRTIQSSPGNIFINGGQSHRLSSTRHCPSSPPGPGSRIAIQNSDPAFDEDLVILSTLENSVEQPLPFCCHEELLAMTPPQLVEVAQKLNACLPAALALRTALGAEYGPEELRRNIERVVGIRTEPVQTPDALPPQPQIASSSGRAIPSNSISRVLSSAFSEDFDDASSEFPSPPTSPLARTKYAHFSAAFLSPRTRLTPLDEEPPSAEETRFSVPSGQQATHARIQGISPPLPNPWEDPATFADVSTMGDPEPSDDETDSDSDMDIEVESRRSVSRNLPSSSSISSSESSPAAVPVTKVRRTQSMRAQSSTQGDASASTSGRVLRSQSQRVAIGVEKKPIGKARRTSVGSLAGRDTSFITTRRPSYRSKVKEETETGPSLQRSQSERQKKKSGPAALIRGLGRRSTVSGGQSPAGKSKAESKHKREKSSISIATGMKRKRRVEQDNDADDEGDEV